MPFPVVGHQDAPQIGMPVERRCRTGRRPRARASRPPDRPTSRSARADRRPAARTFSAQAPRAAPAPPARRRPRPDTPGGTRPRSAARPADRSTAVTSARNANCSAGMVAQRAARPRARCSRSTQIVGMSTAVDRVDAPRQARPARSDVERSAEASMGQRDGSGAHPLLVDLALQLDDAVDQRLGPRRAAGHEHVDRHDLVARPGRSSSCRTRRRSWRRRPSKSPTSARASGRRCGAAPAPSSATAGPATIIRSDWRGEPRNTSAPNRAMS